MNSIYIQTNNNISISCGNYFTLFGFQITYSSSSYLYYISPVLETPNFYAISVKVSVLFIDNWDSSATLNFKLNSLAAAPFSTFIYNNKGAVGEQLCGTNTFDYIFILTGKVNLQPTGNNSY